MTAEKMAREYCGIRQFVTLGDAYDAGYLAGQQSPLPLERGLRITDAGQQVAYNYGFQHGQQSLQSRILNWIDGRMNELGYEESDTGAFVPNSDYDEPEFYALFELEAKLKEIGFVATKEGA